MHIVIPMSGAGKRFQAAGYSEPKPLVPVDGKPMISFVVSMFPGESKLSFICNREHLETTPLKAVLEELAPGCVIFPVEPHKKGPVYAVSRYFDRIEDDEEVIVNYCDFYSDWDYADFLFDTRTRKADGAVAAYRGFHPHMLGTDNYAFIREQGRWLEAIQEKMPFTDNRMAEYASNGTYYFRRGGFVKKYFQSLIDRNIEVNGEYYVSMVYNLLVEAGLAVSVYEVPHMLQWGTPKDLEEYLCWSDIFRDRVAVPVESGNSAAAATCVVPMAGRGDRFRKAGYETPKPLINVSGKPMVVQATNSLPPCRRHIFIALAEHLKRKDEGDIESALRSAFPGCSIVAIDGVTEGQACTTQIGLSESEPPVGDDDAIIIGACDNGMIFDEVKWNSLVKDLSVDAIAFTFRSHPAGKRNPQMYGWLKVDDRDRIVGVSVKVPISDHPERDHAIVGSFYFRRAADFHEALSRLKCANKRVNGEFYVDSLIGELVEMGRTCKVFEVDHYICWGTPDDLRVFEYWQEFFHNCPWHPYKIALDPTADRRNKEWLQSVERPFRQPVP